MTAHRPSYDQYGPEDHHAQNNGAGDVRQEIDHPTSRHTVEASTAQLAFIAIQNGLEIRVLRAQNQLLIGTVAELEKKNRILALKVEEQRVRNEFDLLTGVRVRSAYPWIIEDQPLPPAVSAVLFIDVNDFKEVNDKYGHAAGDVVLREIALTIQSAIRTWDLYRYGTDHMDARERDEIIRSGGDEFVIILNHCSPRVARKRADQIRLAVHEHPIRLGSDLLHVSISVGIAPRSLGRTFRELALAADSDMYADKASMKMSIAYGDRKASLTNSNL